MDHAAPHPGSTWRRAHRRAGVRTLLVGLALAAASVVLTVRVVYPTGLGVMLGLVLLYMAALYLIAIGALRLRTGADGAGDQGPTALALKCLVVDHRFVRVPARVDAPELWRCRRCGKRRYTEPVSAGETIGATRVDQLWIRRGDE